MYLDITELQAFYASPLGRTAQMLIRARLMEAWPDFGGGVTLGFGYAGPLLRGLEGTRPPVLLASSGGTPGLPVTSCAPFNPGGSRRRWSPAGPPNPRCAIPTMSSSFFGAYAG